MGGVLDDEGFCLQYVCDDGAGKSGGLAGQVWCVATEYSYVVASNGEMSSKA